MREVILEKEGSVGFVEKKEKKVRKESVDFVELLERKDSKVIVVKRVKEDPSVIRNHWV